jgi:23S rRNA pseudouridine1911/1915/1917 synthase
MNDKSTINNQQSTINNPQTSIEDQILYEDNHLLILNKKNSQIVHGDKTNDISLEDMVKDYLRVKYNKKGNVYCGVVHRLDRPVSGCVIFAKTEKALVRLNAMVKNHEIHKTYWAITRQKPPKEQDTLKNYMLRDEKKNKSFITKDVNKGSYAELDYRLIAQSEYYYLLEVNLKTGRHHQIRLQLSHIGCPIKGDLKYGFGRSNKIASISLHARRLQFIHPVKKTPIDIIAPVPSDPLWLYFQDIAQEYKFLTQDYKEKIIPFIQHFNNTPFLSVLDIANFLISIDKIDKIQRRSFFHFVNDEFHKIDEQGNAQVFKFNDDATVEQILKLVEDCYNAYSKDNHIHEFLREFFPKNQPQQ